jgi:hypothetical protein
MRKKLVVVLADYIMSLSNGEVNISTQKSVLRATIALFPCLNGNNNEVISIVSAIFI